jgi:amidase
MGQTPPVTDVEELLDTTDATGVAEAVRDGSVHAADILAATAARLAERNPVVNAVIEERLDAARADVEAGLPDGPLCGVPFVVKGLGAQIAGLTTTHGSALWADAVAEHDSELVARYRRAGLVLVGLTNTPEFGLNATTEPLLHGPTRNPYALSRSAGGSSGGTGAAVAAGIVPAGHGTDGGGSIRIPSAMCGLVGLKPSRGRVSTAPVPTLFASPQSVAHALTRSVRDSARLLDIASGPVPGDPYVITPPDRPYVDELDAEPGPLRVAFDTRTPAGDEIHPDCVAAVEATASLLRDLGHTVVPAQPAYAVDDVLLVLRTFFGLTAVARVDNRMAELGRELRDDDLEPFTRAVYDNAQGILGSEVIVAMQALERAAHRVGAFFEEHDLLVTATVAQPTPPLGLLDVTDLEAMMTNAGKYSAMTGVFNVTGQPALSLPLARDADGMPIGVQLAAAFGREDLLVRVGAQLERAQPWSIRPMWPARN